MIHKLVLVLKVWRECEFNHLTIILTGSWNRKFGILFLDNPIGAGFSIATTPKEIPRDQLSIAKHLFAAITSLIELEPLLFKSRPLYFAGESYAGKYVPAIGYYILKANANLPVSQQVTLGGVTIGNGLTDLITQVATHATHARICKQTSGFYCEFWTD